jgi:membrane protease YdiL (CAAX protease family)
MSLAVPLQIRSAAPARAVLLLLGVGCASVTRGLLNGHSLASALLSGIGFGTALLLMAVLAGWRPALPSVRSAGLGLAGGALLVGVPRLLGHGPVIPLGMGPGADPAWLLGTAFVVTAEEVVLRGVLLDAVDEAAGFGTAVAVSSLAFALLHVPLYGWGVVPVDLAAGVWLAGLRATSGGVAAPVVAHLLADLAAWVP